MSDLERCTITVDGRLLARYDKLLKRHGYASRSEGIRDLIRNALVDEDWGSPDALVAATVTLVYDHHQRELTERLDRHQHQHVTDVVSKTHVHLDAEHCLEVVILRGKSKDVRNLAEHLVAERGVKHGKIVFTTAGPGVW